MSIAAAIAELVAAHAAAWEAGDVDAVAGALGLPHMLARADGTTFIEDDAGLDEWIAARLADWDVLGVVAVTAAVTAIEPLPDDAARVTSDWRLSDAAGAEVLAFAATDTCAADDGEWYYVVTDLAGEDAAATGRA